MLDQLTDPHNLPFAVALALMLLLALAQLVGLGHFLGGHTDIDGDVQGDVDLDAGLLSLFGIGRVPFLMWLMLLLTLFGLIGLSLQQLLVSLTGGTLTAWIAAPLAALAAFPGTGIISRPLGAIIPRDETTAVSLDSLVGCEGEVTIGIASAGNAARVRVRDIHGLDHYVMVEPDGEGQSFAQGERILLVRREGDIFRAITRGDRYLPQLD